MVTLLSKNKYEFIDDSILKPPTQYLTSLAWLQNKQYHYLMASKFYPKEIQTNVLQECFLYHNIMKINILYHSYGYLDSL